MVNFFLKNLALENKILSMAKTYYYAVQKGHTQGVFNSWDACKSQISGYSGAVYKKFSSYSEAQSFSNSSSGYSGSSSSSASNGSTSNRRSTSNGRDAICAKPSLSYYSPSYASHSSSYPGISKPAKISTKSTNAEKYYAVKSSSPQIASKIFTNWKDCKSYVYRKKGLSFMKFDLEDGARNYIDGTSNATNDYKHIAESQSSFLKNYSIPSNLGKKFNKTVNVYCDGSSLSNGMSGARAGYGVFFDGESENNISERLRNGAQTNNRGEIQAVSSALEKIWNNLTTKDEKSVYKIKSDSEYVVKLLNDRYSNYSDQKLNTLPNSDLIKTLIQNYTKVRQYYEINKDHFVGDTNFQLEWVEGHAGHEGNELADQLAREGAAKD